MNAKCLIGSLGILGVAIGALAYPVAWGIDRASGIDVLQVWAAPAKEVEFKRGMWELNGSERDGVAGIYGTPTGKSERVVFIDTAKVLHPREDPALTLYLAAQQDHPLQARTLYFFALPTTIGGLVVGAALFLIARRKKGVAAAAPAVAD